MLVKMGRLTENLASRMEVPPGIRLTWPSTPGGRGAGQSDHAELSETPDAEAVAMIMALHRFEPEARGCVGALQDFFDVTVDPDEDGDGWIAAET